jgi:ubiquitin-protein ligase E3 A
LKVSFVGEEGVDYSGVQKEFFQMLVEAVFGKDLGLWKYDETQRFFWFSHKRSPDARRLFKFAGILFALAVRLGLFD